MRIAKGPGTTGFSQSGDRALPAVATAQQETAGTILSLQR